MRFRKQTIVLSAATTAENADFRLYMLALIMEEERIKKNDNLKTVAKLFLKLGVIGFGGPAVHIAMMEEEVVRKRK